MRKLEGQVAIVTGSTSGIGAGVARQLALDGAKVVINGRDASKGRAIVEQIAAAGGEALFVPGSVMSEADMAQLVNATVDAFGQVDVMVASAGGMSPEQTRSPDARGLFHQIKVAKVVELIAGATTGKLNPAHAVVPHMIGRRSGSIIFITSEGGRVPTPGQTGVAFYAGGLIMGTRLLAKELARHEVRVNCVTVTLVDETQSWDGSEGHGEMTELHRKQYQKIRERAPFGIAKPDDVGSIVAFLASDGSRFITGSNVSATGGLTI